MQSFLLEAGMQVIKKQSVQNLQTQLQNHIDDY